MDPLISKLHQRNLSLSSLYQDTEGKLIDSIQEFDIHRGYQKMGYKSLFSYCRDNLKMSENQTYSVIRVSRKSIEVPALKQAVINKEISLTSAKIIAPVLTIENQYEWIEKAKQLPKQELEKALVSLNPKAVKRDRFIPLSESLSEARGVLSTEAKKILDRVKEIESKRNSKPCDLDAAIIAMGKQYLKMNDPVIKAERIETKKKNALSKKRIEDKTTTVPQAQLKSRRNYPAHITNQIILRDKGRCRVMENGKPCDSRHYTEIHHIKPFSLGGSHSLHNLVTLCSGHHRSLHSGAKLYFSSLIPQRNLLDNSA